MAIKQAEL